MSMRSHIFVSRFIKTKTLIFNDHKEEIFLSQFRHMYSVGMSIFCKTFTTKDSHFLLLFIPVTWSTAVSSDKFIAANQMIVRNNVYYTFM